ncbi:hypothetical protein PHISCL_01152 [Aspergillus sclerotialis]|uniref:Mucin n=1 Tax=Aspergillus sclerotialis TaxID=2070753 RepID=A0A3A2ZTQ0_9EURO|nr:hypothetical protein PHISCL_01152 [Aspergillus sclerotialis]
MVRSFEFVWNYGCFSNNAQPSHTLAQTRHNRGHGRLHPPRLADVPGRLHFASLRNRSFSAKSPSRKRRLDKSLLKSHKLCKPRSLQLAYLAAQADSLCFYSLPAKIQQTHFSEEERFYIHQAYHQNVFLHTPDQTLYRLEKERQTFRSLSSRTSQSTFPTSQTSTLYFDSDGSSDSDEDSSENMDDSLYDSFRWLDEDADLDLTLDGYQGPIAGATAKAPPRRRPSFRRTMSFNTVQLGRKPPLAITHRRIPSLSRLSHTSSPLAKTTSRTSISRPPSRQPSTRYVPRSSISTIDPSAQYYQDPEARLKLRVFLASPQKFDEAIEYGFPALDKENQPPKQSPVEEKSKPLEFTGTFLDDDDVSISEDNDNEDQPTHSRLSNELRENSPKSAALCNGQWQPWTPSQSGPRLVSGNREMTLKMTLTRPDLRTESSTPSSVESPQKETSGDSGPGVSESEVDDEGAMKKMWRRLWKPKS